MLYPTSPMDMPQPYRGQIRYPKVTEMNTVSINSIIEPFAPVILTDYREEGSWLVIDTLGVYIA